MLTLALLAITTTLLSEDAPTVILIVKLAQMEPLPHVLLVLPMLSK